MANQHLTLLILSTALGIMSAVAQETKPSDFYEPYWKTGELDPARGKRHQQPAVYEDRLERIPVAPKYVSYISEGDRYNSLQYFHFHPRYNADGSLTVKQERPHHTVVLFVDLGRAMPGTIELEADPPEGVVITFETGEALHPKQKYSVNALPDGSRKTFAPHIEHAGWAGMRYVWIRFENIDKPFTLYRLNGICQIRPSNYVGNFECNDEMLNRIWEMCAYSAHAVMGQPVGNDPEPKAVLQTLCMDRVDRHPWAGDSRVIQKSVEYIFGEYELIRRANENFVPLGTRPIPLMQTVVPYTLDWALAEIDYYRVSGDSAHFARRLPDLLATVEEFDPYTHPKKGWYFFDWDKRIVDNPSQEQAAFFGKYIQLCRETAAAAAAQTSGNRPTADSLTAKADQYAAQWKKTHPHWYETCDIHALTNLLLGGILTGDDVPRIYQKVYADPSQRCTNTPYFGFYILQALTQMGRRDKALEMIRHYWGTMIRAGATTVWEEWHPTWTLPVGMLPPQYEPPKAWSGLSLIQPSGAGPANWLLSEIIGIRPQTPGFRDVCIEPNPVDLQWATGTVATPSGPVTVEWKIEGRQLQLRFDVPEHCQSVTLTVPRGKKYLLGNRKISPDRTSDGKASFTLRQRSNTLTVLN
jgi:hypothetical protein